jgi:hypothetical protein
LPPKNDFGSSFPDINSNNDTGFSSGSDSFPDLPDFDSDSKSPTAQAMLDDSSFGEGRTLRNEDLFLTSSDYRELLRCLDSIPPSLNVLEGHYKGIVELNKREEQLYVKMKEKLRQEQSHLMLMDKMLFEF